MTHPSLWLTSSLHNINQNSHLLPWAFSAKHQTPHHHPPTSSLFEISQHNTNLTPSIGYHFYLTTLYSSSNFIINKSPLDWNWFDNPIDSAETPQPHIVFILKTHHQQTIMCLLQTSFYRHHHTPHTSEPQIIVTTTCNHFQRSRLCTTEPPPHIIENGSKHHHHKTTQSWFRPHPLRP